MLHVAGDVALLHLGDVWHTTGQRHMDGRHRRPALPQHQHRCWCDFTTTAAPRRTSPATYRITSSRRARRHLPHLTGAAGCGPRFLHPHHHQRLLRPRQAAAQEPWVRQMRVPSPCPHFGTATPRAPTTTAQVLAVPAAVPLGDVAGHPRPHRARSYLHMVRTHATGMRCLWCRHRRRRACAVPTRRISDKLSPFGFSRTESEPDARRGLNLPNSIWNGWLAILGKARVACECSRAPALTRHASAPRCYPRRIRMR